MSAGVSAGTVTFCMSCLSDVTKHLEHLLWRTPSLGKLGPQGPYDLRGRDAQLGQHGVSRLLETPINAHVNLCGCLGLLWH